MIEVTIYGKVLGKCDGNVQINIDASDLSDIDITIKFFIFRLMARSVATFDPIDTIMLSNHDSGYVQSWSVTEEHQDAAVVSKYIEFVSNDIMQWMDTTRDKTAEKLLRELMDNGCSVTDMLDALIQKGYSSEFSGYWVATQQIT